MVHQEPLDLVVGKEVGRETLKMRGVEAGLVANYFDVDDDGRYPRRTGTWVSATAHIITAVIGSGVLSLGWAMAQLGWAFGPLILLLFSIVSYYTALLLCMTYRTMNLPDGKRHYNYMSAVKAHLGTANQIFCAMIQYTNLFSTGVGYVVTGSLSVVAAKRSICFHNHGGNPNAPCRVSNSKWMIFFGALQLAFSQVPNIEELWWLSYLATAMSFTYSFIGLGLSIGRVTESDRGDYGTALGLSHRPETTEAEATWNVFVALGSMAFAYSFSMVLIEIQDTIKQGKNEYEEMKTATKFGIGISTAFYITVGCVSYAAFGDFGPGNMLTGFGFFNPYWQPFFFGAEDVCIYFFPRSAWHKFYELPFLGRYPLYPMRFAVRSFVVVVSTVVIHFPVEMYMVQKKITNFSWAGIGFRVLSLITLLVSLAAAIGSIEYVVKDVQEFKPFHSYSDGTSAK